MSEEVERRDRKLREAKWELRRGNGRRWRRDGKEVERVRMESGEGDVGGREEEVGGGERGKEMRGTFVPMSKCRSPGTKTELRA